MDPTAPNGPNSQNPQGGTSQTPIQPGQFVVAGDDAPAPTPTPQQGGQNQQQPAVSLAGQRPETPQVTPNSPASGAGMQPDPTPFTPVGQPPQDPAQSASQMPETPKKNGGPKTLLVILAVLILLGIIAAVAYFFVLPMLNGQKATTQTVDEVEIIEESPPERTELDTSFGQLPESTQTPEDTLPESFMPQEEVPVDPLTNPAQ